MRYDFGEANPHPEFSPAFFEWVDERVFPVAMQFMPWKQLPFDNLIPFDLLPTMDVLEIGVGCGSHASLLAPRARSYVGIDLTEYGTRATRTRLDISNSPGGVVRMDGESMGLRDKSVDFIWSWGVIHHSADTSAIIKEMRRVLRPGGRAVTMVYHRNWWNMFVMAGLFHGLARGMLRGRSLHAVRQMNTDGALARYYRVNEWEEVVSPYLNVVKSSVVGCKTEIVPLPRGKAKSWVVERIPDAAGRLFTNRMRMGMMLVTEYSG